MALYSGICVPNDAISNSLRHKLEILKSWAGSGLDLEFAAYVQFNGYPKDPCIRTVNSVAELIRIPEFWTSDVHIFEFGIYFALFDAVFLIPEETPTIGIYHNITPEEFVSGDRDRDAISRSLIQRSNLGRMTRIVSDSEFSTAELLALGFSRDKLSTLPLPPLQREYQRNSVVERRSKDPLEILYVGRFVRSKGVLDLLKAAVILAENFDRRFRLTMCGDPRFSSPDVLVKVESWCSSEGAELARVIMAPSDNELARLYAEADIFVMPSYHEGYCVPIVEALAANCYVVAYDSSNIPFVLAGLGTLVPTGDIASLAAALEKLMDCIDLARTSGIPVVVPTEQGDIEAGDWRQRVDAHLKGLSFSSFEAGFAELMAVTLPRMDEMLPRRPLKV